MRRRKRNNIKSRLSFDFSNTGKLAVLIAGLLVIFQIFNAIQTSSSGAVLAELERKERELIKANEELQTHIVDKNSLIKIRQRSDELGYNSPEQTFYITEQDSVALLK